jgi:hypothetical protein
MFSLSCPIASAAVNLTLGGQTELHFHWGVQFYLPQSSSENSLAEMSEQIAAETHKLLPAAVVSC